MVIDANYQSLTLSHFARAANLTLISVGSDGNIEFANPSACTLFGYESDEIVGQPITIIIPERMRGAHMAGLARVAAGEKPNLAGKTVESPAIKKDGTEFPIEITLSVGPARAGSALEPSSRTSPNGANATTN
ncbi:hypothetical protein B7W85_22125 [Allorhizobium ampelinum]|uniref:PAS domain S-box protein n=1 Tax=Rhizobium/Agrobacterium group TaxID=227290 RepID=UPI0008DC110E|nr:MULTISPECIES: PAS domain S-box protein [Rhizobium/Agrobacterium group]MCF1465080.1 PAS domain S-box protein [Allorhizobium ampelinum]MCF1496211.1 PAS domain S-box protein [Allorhizobium ampelinum]MUO92594.1 PAS domain S-box protein [Agrobacterium vitis]MUZ94800.1 PAS domain S-box protein [Agrobacterium vitis]MVA48965.1 PAS domain S-box protein [Agrobacterium vitis]